MRDNWGRPLKIFEPMEKAPPVRDLMKNGEWQGEYAADPKKRPPVLPAPEEKTKEQLRVDGYKIIIGAPNK